MRGLEWAAGLFEGEGTIIIRQRNYGGKTLQLALYNTDRDVVFAFKKAVKIGPVCGPYRGNKIRIGKYKSMYQWYAYGVTAQRILRQLLPFFCSRRKLKAKKALQLKTNKRNRVYK